jgi:hypothetical protein
MSSLYPSDIRNNADKSDEDTSEKVLPDEQQHLKRARTIHAKRYNNDVALRKTLARDKEINELIRMKRAGTLLRETNCLTDSRKYPTHPSIMRIRDVA